MVDSWNVKILRILIHQNFCCQNFHYVRISEILRHCNFWYVGNSNLRISDMSEFSSEILKYQIFQCARFSEIQICRNFRIPIHQNVGNSNVRFFGNSNTSEIPTNQISNMLEIPQHWNFEYIKISEIPRNW